MEYWRASSTCVHGLWINCRKWMFKVLVLNILPSCSLVNWYDTYNCCQCTQCTTSSRTAKEKCIRTYLWSARGSLSCKSIRQICNTPLFLETKEPWEYYDHSYIRTDYLPIFLTCSMYFMKLWNVWNAWLLIWLNCLFRGISLHCIVCNHVCVRTWGDLFFATLLSGLCSLRVLYLITCAFLLVLECVNGIHWYQSSPINSAANLINKSHKIMPLFTSIDHFLSQFPLFLPLSSLSYLLLL